MSNIGIGSRDNSYEKIRAIQQNGSGSEELQKHEPAQSDIDAMYSIYLKYTEIGHGDNSPVLIQEIQDYIDSNELNTTAEIIKQALISRYKTEKQQNNETNNNEPSPLSDYLNNVEKSMASQNTRSSDDIESDKESILSQLELEKSNLEGLEKQKSTLQSNKTQTETILSNINANLLKEPDKNDYIYGFNEIAEEKYNKDLNAYKNQQAAIKQLEEKLAQLENDMESTEKSIEETNTAISGLETKLNDIETRENEKEINEYLSDNYPEYTGDIDLIKSLARIDTEGTDIKTKIDVAIGLEKAAEEKGVDKTDYISSRYAAFIQMKTENPDLTLEEMNEQLALNYIMETDIETLTNTVSSMFGEEISSFDDLLNMQPYELMLADELPEARETYLVTNKMLYISLANSGELTQEDYYELIKLNLLNLFPNADEMEDGQKEDISKRIDSLSPEEVEDYINKTLSLPGCYADEYSDSLNKLLTDFYSKTNRKEAYILDNPNELKSLEEIYKSSTGVAFNPDAIIDAQLQLEKLEDVINTSLTYSAVQDICKSVESSELDEGSALWQIAFIYTGSTESEDIVSFIKAITGVDNIYVENNKVISSRVLKTRGGENSDPKEANSSIFDAVKDWCKSEWYGTVNTLENIWDGLVDTCVPESIQELEANVDFTTIEGWEDYLEGLFTNWDTLLMGLQIGSCFMGAGLAANVGKTAAATGGKAVLNSEAGTVIEQALYKKIVNAAELMGASHAIANIANFIQQGDYSSEGLTNLLAGLSESAVVGANVMSAGTTEFVVPKSLQGPLKKVMGKISSGVSYMVERIMDKAARVVDGFGSITAEELGNFDYWINTAFTGRYRTTYLTREERDALTGFKGIKVPILGAKGDEGPWEYIGVRYCEYILPKNYCNVIEQSIIKIKGASRSIIDGLKAIANGSLATDTERNAKTFFLKDFIKRNKITTPITVSRAEVNTVIMDKFVCGGKTLTQWLSECKNNPALRTKVEEMFRNGNFEFVSDDILRTSMNSDSYKYMNSSILLDDGVGALFNTFGHIAEWETLIAPGTKFKIVSGYFNEAGVPCVQIVATNVEGTVIKEFSMIMQDIATAGIIANNNSIPESYFKNQSGGGSGSSNHGFIDVQGHQWPSYDDYARCQQNNISWDEFNKYYGQYLNSNIQQGQESLDCAQAQPDETNGITNPFEGNLGKNTEQNSSPTDNCPGMTWGPGNPIWEELYGGSNIEIGEILFERNEDFSKFIYGTTAPNVEAAYQKWIDWTPEERSEWLSAYIQNYYADKFANVDNIKIAVQCINGILSVRVIKEGIEINIDGNVDDINAKIEELAKDSSRDIASINGLFGSAPSQNTNNTNSTKNSFILSNYLNYDGSLNWQKLQADGWGTSINGTNAQDALKDLQNGNSIEYVINKYKPTTSSNDKTSSGGNNNYGQTGGQTLGLGDQGFNDVFGGANGWGYDQGYSLGLDGQWYQNGSPETWRGNRPGGGGASVY